MQYGFVLPVTDPARLAELGEAAEQAGWDAVFVAEMIWGPDAWVSLTAIAMKTERIGLGTMLSPISRMRPWKLASETATLDRISNGRVRLAVGLGAIDTGFAEFGEATDRKTRIELMEEGLELVQLLWKNEPFTFRGKHYQVDTSSISADMLKWGVSPVQQPRIPIWLTGAWPREVSMQRTFKFDGLLPNFISSPGPLGVPPVDEFRAMSDYAREHIGDRPFDIVMEGETADNSNEQLETVDRWRRAGATWWIESPWSRQDDLEYLRKRIEMGPPRVEALVTRA
jgi:alkanesulfonate monooxygenase SsuD/methylene tetrahydromethanopterin reductase-like flavin-dependent oxidoreductase (luciferase family)